MIKAKNKHCPRCNLKLSQETVVCPSCQLNFQKFNSATNLEGKKALRQGEKERVLYRKGCPTDVNKFALLALAIFLGYTGAHLYRVGRTGKGILYSVFCIVGVIYTVITSTLNFLPSGDLWQIFMVAVLVWAVVTVMWIIDVFNIMFNKFKIPVSRELK